MKYDLTNDRDKEKFKARVNKLFERGAYVELTDKSNRSKKQNAYLHVILSAFALEFGYTLETVKRLFYKLESNKDLFLRDKKGRLGTKKYLRSSSELTKEEMTLSIERFRKFSSENGCYLPEPNEESEIRAIEKDYQRYKHLLT